MHEMSITASLIEIIEQEMAKHSVSKLLMVRVKFGTLSNLVPEAMRLAFEVMTKDTPLQGAALELVEIPLTMACGACKAEFTPEDRTFLLAPCPACGYEFGHAVLTGKELYLDHLEAE